MEGPGQLLWRGAEGLLQDASFFILAQGQSVALMVGLKNEVQDKAA